MGLERLKKLLKSKRKNKFIINLLNLKPRAERGCFLCFFIRCIRTMFLHEVLFGFLLKSPKNQGLWLVTGCG